MQQRSSRKTLRSRLGICSLEDQLMSCSCYVQQAAGCPDLTPRAAFCRSTLKQLCVLPHLQVTVVGILGCRARMLQIRPTKPPSFCGCNIRSGAHRHSRGVRR